MRENGQHVRSPTTGLAVCWDVHLKPNFRLDIATRERQRTGCPPYQGQGR